jgi:shikimate kinase
MSAAPALNRQTIVLVGLMGSGKSSIGRRLATALDMPFVDADTEVETAAGQSISEIFAELGEAAFRDGERRVIARLLDDPPHILATGGGAFVNDDTRALILRKGVSVWLKADLDVLVRRVARKNTRPLLAGKDPAQVLHDLAQVRYPFYAQANVTVETGDTQHKAAVDAVIAGVTKFLSETPA